jgi:protein Tex
MQNSSHLAGSHQISDVSRIAQDLQIRKLQVENVVQLLDEGNTVPFITRYRKERTGGLNEEIIRRIQERILDARHLAERKQTILKSIEGQGKLTDALRDAILAADNPKRLEDLYLPFKPKKKSLAAEAREKGLEPLALAIWNRDPSVDNLADAVQALVNPEKYIGTPEEILAGVQHIHAEMVAEMAEVRGPVRFVIWDSGELVSTKAENVVEDKARDYRDYFEFRESIRFIPAHRILAVNRGEKENVLKVKIEWNNDRVRAATRANLPFARHPHLDLLDKAVEDGLARLLLPSLEREIRRELTEHAQDSAVHIFARNLRSLLLQPPLRGRRVLAIDPGLRSGCKIAALDETGKLLQDAVIYPHGGHRIAEAKSTLEKFIRRHQTPVIAIGNGTACRETEQIISELIADIESGKTCVLPDPPPRPPRVIPVQPSAASVPPDSATTPISEAAPPTAPTAEAQVAPPVESPAAPPVEAPPQAPSPEVPPPADITPQATDVAAPIPDAPQPVAPMIESPPLPPPPPPEVFPDLPKDIAYVIVNEAGASDYSASPIAREEFPNHDATTRGTVSIGRRLQDPLSELVKIDPQHVGVGLYQHDVRPKHLKGSLEAVIESCVNEVGVDLNTASIPLLRHVSGLNQMVARDLVEFRSKQGAFRSREQLKEIPGIGEARYVQAAGFLKIPEGDEPLDTTWIHPESYHVARQVLADLGFSPADLRDREKLESLRGKLTTVQAADLATRMNVGEPTVRDILESLAKPGRDPRDDRPPPIFKKGILKLEDLQPGMELKGTILNVVPFGAFVDIGLKDTGLVHISQMANRYIKNPYEVVAVGDVVTVWVIKVEGDRRRASLTMIPPGTERKPPERKPSEPRPPRAERPPQGDRPPQVDRGPRPPRSEGPPQRAAGPPPHRGGPREGGPSRGPRPGGPSRGAPTGPPRHGNDRSAPLSAPTPPPAPPRKPSKPKPLPKLSQEALKGKTPLHTFGELEAFFKAKDEPPAPPQSTEPKVEPSPPSVDDVAPQTAPVEVEPQSKPTETAISQPPESVAPENSSAPISLEPPPAV